MASLSSPGPDGEQARREQLHSAREKVDRDGRDSRGEDDPDFFTKPPAKFLSITNRSLAVV